MRSNKHRLVPGDEYPWSLRDTLALLGLYVWGAGFTTLALLSLANRPLGPGTLFALLALIAGLAGLYLAIGATAVRLGEIIRARRGQD